MVKECFSYISSQVHSSKFHIVMVVEVIDNYIMKLRRYVGGGEEKPLLMHSKTSFLYINVYKS